MTDTPTRRVRSPVFHGVLHQSALLALGLLMLDGGTFLRRSAAASVGYWIGILLISLRRPEHLTAFDRKFVTWGLWGLAAVGVLLGELLGRY